MTEPDPDALARRTLRSHRMFASGLLILMATLTIATYLAPPNWWSGLLQASAKAGFIGGIADWFAVTALFRHPLGIPIPHTAIIPNQRGRLGQALGRFVANHVFTGEEVSQRACGFGPAEHLASFSGRPRRRSSRRGRTVRHAAKAAGDC